MALQCPAKELVDLHPLLYHLEAVFKMVEHLALYRQVRVILAEGPALYRDVTRCGSGGLECGHQWDHTLHTYLYVCLSEIRPAAYSSSCHDGAESSCSCGAGPRVMIQSVVFDPGARGGLLAGASPRSQRRARQSILEMALIVVTLKPRLQVVDPRREYHKEQRSR